MPITVKEKRVSRSQVSSSNPTHRREYVAYGSDVGDDIVTAVAAVAPATVNTLQIDTIDASPREASESAWDVVVTYKTNKFGNPATATGGSEYSFEIATQNSHITRGLGTISSYGTNPPDFKGSIGYDGEKFEGADILVPVFSFSETHYVAVASVTATFKANIFAAAGKVNSDTFRNFAAGEVLFIGAAGTLRNEDDYAINYRFACAPNITGVSVGALTGIAKQGWEYLWAIYEEVEDATAKFITYQPKYAYVEKVYETANMTTLLGI